MRTLWRGVASIGVWGVRTLSGPLAVALTGIMFATSLVGSGMAIQNARDADEIAALRVELRKAQQRPHQLAQTDLCLAYWFGNNTTNKSALRARVCGGK